MQEGLVLKKYSGFYYVQDRQQKLYECRVRGKIKQEVLTGDQVVFTAVSGHKGVIERIQPRYNQLDRPHVANVSLALIIMAFSQPLPSLMLLDRLLILCGYHHIRPLIILNKNDLPMDSASQEICSHYPSMGYQVIQASAEKGDGLDDIRAGIVNEIAVLTGPSGVGKSSLLNAILENEEARTQELSRKLGRGKHTTRHVELYPLKEGGWMVDTPGFSMLEMPPLKRMELAAMFPEFAEGADRCRFRNCQHYKEQDCGVRDDLEAGCISPSRYRNYIYILEEIMENERKYP